MRCGDWYRRGGLRAHPHASNRGTAGQSRRSRPIEPLEGRTLLSAGDLDPTFGAGGIVTTDFLGSAGDQTRQIALQADGKLLEVASHSGYVVLEPTIAVTRFNVDGSLDTSFGNDGLVLVDFPGRGEFNGSIDLTPDGKIVVATWSFFPTTDAGAVDSDVSVAMLNPDGRFDTSFDGDGMKVFDIGQALGGPAAAKTSDVTPDVAVQPDGKILTASGLTVNNQGRFAVSRINPDGTLDASFGTGGVASAPFGDYSGRPTAITVDGQGRVVVAGMAGIPGTDGRVSNTEFTVARFTPQGNLDATFDGDGFVVIPFGPSNESLNAIEMAPGGKIVVTGNITISGSPTGDIPVARLNDDGSLDATFDGDGKAEVGLTIVNKLGQTVASGDFAYGLAVQDDAAILLSGFNITSAGGAVGNAILVRLDPTGALDGSFGVGGKVVSPKLAFAADVVLQRDSGSVFVGGFYSTSPNSFEDFAAEHYDPAGRRDTSYGAGGTASADFPAPSSNLAYAAAVDAQGRIIAGGRAGPNSGHLPDLAFARYNPDGALDPTFGAGGRVQIELGARSGHRERVTALTIDAQGRVVFTGVITDPSDPTLRTEKIIVGRLLPDGSLDASFASGTGLFVAGAFAGNAASSDQSRDILIDPVGRIVVAGEYAPTRTTPEFAVLRLDPDGNLDRTFGPEGSGMVHFVVAVAAGSTSTANAVALTRDQDGEGFDLVLAGRAHAQFAVVRLNDDGALDPLFGGGTGKATTLMGTGAGEARAVAIDSEGYIVAGGSASSSSQSFNFALARFDPTGVLDRTFGGTGKVLTDFNPGIDFVNSLVVLPDRSIIAAGTASPPADPAGGNSRGGFGLARYTAGGALDRAFGSGGKVVTRFSTGLSSPFANPDIASRLLAYPGNRVVAVGTADTPRTGSDFALARYLLADAPPSEVSLREVFYNHSASDGNDPRITDQDLAAVARDKSPLRPGQAVTFANVTTYARGINGLHLRFTTPLGELSPADFVFKVSVTPPGGPTAWANAPAPAAFSAVRVDGGTHAYFTWADGAINNTWLQVTVLSNARTRLTQPDVFSFGHLIGDTGDSNTTFRCNALDLALTRAAVGRTDATSLNRYDFNRDGRVTAADVLITRANLGRSLPPITAPAGAAGAASSRTQVAARPPRAPAAPARRGVWDDLEGEVPVGPTAPDRG